MELAPADEEGWMKEAEEWRIYTRTHTLPYANECKVMRARSKDCHCLCCRVRRCFGVDAHVYYSTTGVLFNRQFCLECTIDNEQTTEQAQQWQQTNKHMMNNSNNIMKGIKRKKTMNICNLCKRNAIYSSRSCMLLQFTDSFRVSLIHVRILLIYLFLLFTWV